MQIFQRKVHGVVAGVFNIRLLCYRRNRRQGAACYNDLGYRQYFLSCKHDRKIPMLLRGRLAEMMVQVYPSMYRKYATYLLNGQAMLHVRLSKTLYGMRIATLLFYKRSKSDLKSMGFEVNPCNPFVTNKMVNGHQITICWHMDDPKLSHKDEDAVTTLPLNLASLY